MLIVLRWCFTITLINLLLDQSWMVCTIVSGLLMKATGKTIMKISYQIILWKMTSMPSGHSMMMKFKLKDGLILSHLTTSFQEWKYHQYLLYGKEERLRLSLTILPLDLTITFWGVKPRLIMMTCKPLARWSTMPKDLNRMRLSSPRNQMCLLPSSTCQHIQSTNLDKWWGLYTPPPILCGMLGIHTDSMWND